MRVGLLLSVLAIVSLLLDLLTPLVVLDLAFVLWLFGKGLLNGPKETFLLLGLLFVNE